MIRPVLLALALATLVSAQDRDVDTDGDGLSDFHEIHKYLSDPRRSDTDGDGTPDGDWLERREHQYWVRSVVHVMPPVTIDWLVDDYQDARILDRAASHVELEVIHYPFNTVADAITGSKAWRQNTAGMSRWTRAGPTADWTPALRRELLKQLRADGIDAGSLDDRTLVERASRWLLQRSKHQDGYSSFITAFDGRGRPYVPDELRPAAERGKAEKGIGLKDQWSRELSASGMFRHKVHGSCTSTAIYLNGCLRALGIPTRTVLCIPLVDASDERELELLRHGIRHPEVRRTLIEALVPLKNSWASHTFNEVFVGGRWRRLNYDRLGQNILDPALFGLMTHVATFSDWAEARMPETVGRRQAGARTGDVFGGPNPYSAIAIRDGVGPHCQRPLPEAEAETLQVTELHWTDGEGLPENIRQGCERRGRFGLVARVAKVRGRGHLVRFLEEGDRRVYLNAAGAPRLSVGFDPGCWWMVGSDAWIYIPLGPADRRDLRSGPAYTFAPRNEREGHRWVHDDLRITRR